MQHWAAESPSQSGQSSHGADRYFPVEGGDQRGPFAGFPQQPGGEEVM